MVVISVRPFSSVLSISDLKKAGDAEKITKKM
jgi:hypothetical protein